MVQSIILTEVYQISISNRAQNSNSILTTHSTLYHREYVWCVCVRQRSVFMFYMVCIQISIILFDRFIVIECKLLIGTDK